ncbi:hypothetical protein RIEGSTA812A_PEG_310 [invertebrate metagenome]|uniref:Uncharacterized protein n=1 Tax=invertebrate metagenome TaxID=1711999 RepID=A0A484H4W6_9ZZZZ
MRVVTVSSSLCIHLLGPMHACITRDILLGVSAEKTVILG